MAKHTLQVLDIVAGTSVDGPGLRTSIYFAGCAHKCPGCHNPQSWDFGGGSTLSGDEILARVEQEGFNVSFSGGDPVYQLPSLIPLAKAIHQKGFSIWLYTGFTFEQLLQMEKVPELLQYLEVVVDGPFVESLRDTSLLFRGSSNQRLVDVRSSLCHGKKVDWISDAGVIS